MPDPITPIAEAVTSVSELVDGILDRADRDEPDKERNENISTLQNAFAKNDLDSDDFRLFVSRLCNRTGNPLVPTGDANVARRELLHTLLVNTINLIHERKLTGRVIHKLLK